jgi:hypothetical protein
MSSGSKTADEWDAEDIVGSLKTVLYGDGLKAPEVSLCVAHTRALIFLIRRMDHGPRSGFEFALALFKASPGALLGLALLLLVAKYVGVGA